MPETEVRLYQEEDGNVPLTSWLGGRSAEARDRCLAALMLLEKFGHELRRPHAENISGDLYELRVKVRRTNLRMLYFFDGRTAIVVSHGFAKEKKLPDREIKVAEANMKKYRANPRKHTFRREQ